MYPTVLISLVRPQVNATLAVKSARHPIKEKIQQTKYIPNDIYATQQNRFQIVTGRHSVATLHDHADLPKGAT